METKNYERELGTIDNKIAQLERRQDRMETEIDKKLATLDNRFTLLMDKMDTLKDESVFAKGFIKAILVGGSIVGVAVTLIVKIMH